MPTAPTVNASNLSQSHPISHHTANCKVLEHPSYFPTAGNMNFSFAQGAGSTFAGTAVSFVGRPTPSARGGGGGEGTCAHAQMLCRAAYNRIVVCIAIV